MSEVIRMSNGEDVYLVGEEQRAEYEAMGWAVCEGDATQSEEGESFLDLEGLTVAELKQLAEQFDVSATGKKKAELIAVLKDAGAHEGWSPEVVEDDADEEPEESGDE